MSFKSTDHEFEMGNDKVTITEFPFYPGESSHIEYVPYSRFETVSLMGNPEKEQTLFFRTDESLCWIKSDYTLLEKLEKAIIKYKNQWNLHPPPKCCGADTPDCDNCEDNQTEDNGSVETKIKTLEKSTK